MRKLITLTLLMAVLSLYLLPQADAQVLWRGAKTMKKGSFIAMARWYYMDFTKVYDTTNEEWKDNDNDHLKWGFETMIGYAPMDRWEIMMHIPFRLHSFTTSTLDESSSGIGDIFFKTRVAVLPWSKKKHGLTFVGSVRLGTGEYDNPYSFCNCGDGSTDFGVAGIFSSKWMNKFRGHLKLNYWVNGEGKAVNDVTYNVGNEMKFIGKLDYNFHKKFMGFATYIYYNQAEKEDSQGNAIQNSDKTRHSFALGGIWKPKKGIFVRPKIVLPIGAENGKNYSFKPVLDFWYVFALGS
ncbi:hypothetical protein CEE37_02345 [candidate division LCP-89 bacterium B3_LCP]|uniref:Transporter n=1 Tax=candidate division LCP-89 bacterium B3_LCP TaxID=2012998 RepID=A0A532V5T9_UNCL8|nr:MAG: hypothetical protein CEE37_02345 [candidate division LCP-89 bacterium B3_LCP]